MLGGRRWDGGILLALDSLSARPSLIQVATHSADGLLDLDRPQEGLISDTEDGRVRDRSSSSQMASCQMAVRGHTICALLMEQSKTSVEGDVRVCMTRRRGAYSQGSRAALFTMRSRCQGRRRLSAMHNSPSFHLYPHLPLQASVFRSVISRLTTRPSFSSPELVGRSSYPSRVVVLCSLHGTSRVVWSILQLRRKSRAQCSAILTLMPSCSMDGCLIYSRPRSNASSFKNPRMILTNANQRPLMAPIPDSLNLRKPRRRLCTSLYL